MNRPKIFICHAHEDARVAALIASALKSGKYDVFIDRHSLEPGGEYHGRIANEIEQADLFIFLISPHSVAVGSFTLSELEIAMKRWPDGTDSVLPVIVAETDDELIEPYLMAINRLTPKGNIPMSVFQEVRRRFPDPSRGSVPSETEERFRSRPRLDQFSEGRTRGSEKLRGRDGSRSALDKLRDVERLQDQLPAYLTGLVLSKELSEQCTKIDDRRRRGSKEPERLNDEDYWETLRDMLTSAGKKAHRLESALREDAELAPSASAVKTGVADMTAAVEPVADAPSVEKCEEALAGIRDSVSGVKPELLKIAEGSIEAAQERLRLMERAVAELRTWLRVAEGSFGRTSQPKISENTETRRVDG